MTHIKKPDPYICNPSTGKTKIERYLGLVGQPSLINEPQASERYCLKEQSGRAWRWVSLIPALGRQRLWSLSVWGRLGLHSEFQVSHGYIEESYLKKAINQNQKNQGWHNLNQISVKYNLLSLCNVTWLYAFRTDHVVLANPLVCSSPGKTICPALSIS